VTAALERRSGAPDRFEVPIYTVAEAARYLDVPDSTLRSWTHGYRHRVTGRPDVVGDRS
jgi:transposase-like protein